MTRRDLIFSVAAVPAFLSVVPALPEGATLEPATPEPAAPEPATSLPASFPRQAPDMVQEMVIVAHGNVKRVRELVGAHPALAKAAIDWGFGDWEDALGAASHVGSREIAELLIANGARPTIFSAAMLGQLDAVKAFVAGQPGVQRIAGPHSISLLAHAKAGGAAAAAVHEYLERLGDAGGPATAAISDDQKAELAGSYAYGSEPSERITIALEKGTVMFSKPGMPFGRPLYHLGQQAFFPAGASAVRISFGERTVTVEDGDVTLRATKV